MSERILTLTILLAQPFCAQEVFRKPSPFPEKNRARESSVAAKPSSSRAASAARTPARTAPAGDDTVSTAPVAGSSGKACFFSSRPGRALAASGEDVNPDELVAAHATYALGSRVSVTNLANKKTVEVRIVDRFSDPRRIISVSESAARQLGFYEAGTADVKVDAVREEAAGDEAR